MSKNPAQQGSSVPQGNKVQDANPRAVSVQSGAVLQPGTVIFDAVSKRFRKRTLRSYTTVKSTLINGALQRSTKAAPFLTALHEINLNIQPGSSLGVIGRNGSGKSTLLKLIAGIYRPDQGKVRIAGRISALIELGAGFHPDFTGRENVFLGGVMYGLSKKEIQRRFDDIVQYAELEDFIDDPVRTYSSGMYMRLGFSLAVFTEPDILLIDEVLAVGDAAFVHKCKDTISNFKRKGKTLIFVTHDLGAVDRWCDEAMWLDKGRVLERGEPRWVIDRYLQHIEAAEERELKVDNEQQIVWAETSADSVALEASEESVVTESAEKNRWGGGEVQITSVKMLDADGAEKWLYHAGEELTIEVSYQINKRVDDLVFGVGIIRADGLCLHGTNTDIEDLKAPLPSSTLAVDSEGQYTTAVSGTYRYKIDKLNLLEDSYFLDVAAHRSDGYPYDYHHRQYKFSVRTQKRYHGAFFLEHSWEFQPDYAVAEEPLSLPPKVAQQG